MAKVKAIYLRSSREGSVKSVPFAELCVDTGFEGDHFNKPGGKRQVTLLSVQAWDAVCKELGEKLCPSARRANLLIDGIDFDQATGKMLHIGNAIIHIEGETMPCKLMNRVHPHLMEALKKDWRGGAYGRVIQAGSISLGDSVLWVTG